MGGVLRGGEGEGHRCQAWGTVGRGGGRRGSGRSGSGR